jgi:hypothetical protein
MARPGFGKELKRSFEVHEHCFDCAEFYDGCPAWPAAREFACRQCDRLPDALSGTCGQSFPPSRHQLPVHPDPDDGSQQLAENCSQTADVPPANLPTSRPAQPDGPGARTCGCGAPMEKGKRLCPDCRAENRRKTKCRHMRRYMRKRRSQAGGSG